MLIIGHRGACGHTTENTISSVKKSLEIGVDAIEIDVRKTADNKVILMHDYTIDRTTNGTGKVADLTLEQIESYQTEDNQKVPTLEAVLNLVNKQAIVDIEIKDNDVIPYLCTIVSDYLKKDWTSSNFIISSFDLIALRNFYKIEPTINLMAIIANATENWLHILEEIPITMIAAPHDSIYQDFVEEAHENELEVIAYTVNTEEEIKRMFDLCVDGIISDYPDRIKMFI